MVKAGLLNSFVTNGVPTINDRSPSRAWRKYSRSNSFDGDRRGNIVDTAAVVPSGSTRKMDAICGKSRPICISVSCSARDVRMLGQSNPPNWSAARASTRSAVSTTFCACSVNAFDVAKT